MVGAAGFEPTLTESESGVLPLNYAPSTADYITIKITLQLKILSKCDIIHLMNIRLSTIMEFHHRRTQAHVDCLNYYAGLLGYHFPEHDNDKNSGPMQTGYAYANYAKYHPEFYLSDARAELFHEMHAEHHRMQPHHIEHYDDMTGVSDITLIEMICDWHSANFEQNHITHEGGASSVREYFDKELRNRDDLKWSAHQLAIIDEMIDFLALYANFDDIMAIWRPLLAD